MSSFGAPHLTFTALDGNAYKTGLDGWSTQKLSSTGETVFVKLINLGDKTKLIAIDKNQAIKTGVYQLFTDKEKRAAKTAPIPAPTRTDINNLKKEAELVKRIRDKAIGTGTSRKHPWLRDNKNPTAQTRRSEVLDAPTPRKSVTPAKTKPQSAPVDTSVSGMISAEAKRLKKG